MILNSYIHEQLAEGHQRDLMDSAQHYRQTRPARERSGARSRRSVLRGRDPRRRTGLGRRLSVSRPCAATR
jgi:hypothetical protein